jgi:creatinine amidohydrolase
VNTGQHYIYLDINLNPSTQLVIMRDILTVLNRQGVKKLLLINAHGGNDFKPILRELGAEFPEMLLTLCNFFQVLDKKNYFEEEGDHADEMETSIMMYLKPELVLPLEQSGLGEEKRHRIKAIREKWAWAERRWSEVTEDTGIGNPRKSTKKKGERFFNDLTDKISELILELCDADSTNLYQ